MKERTITIITCELSDDDLDSMLNAIQREQGALIQRMDAEY